MKIKSLLCGSAALAAIAIVAPAAAPGGMGLIPAAQAQDVSISFGVFYDSLEPHGRWVNYNDDYVFIPTITYDDWRPYKYGHWIYARDHGWTWASDEKFGWATYHYGRWGYEEDIGWYWVPGRRWAPAWVSWRRSGDHVAWAPIPYRRGYDYDADVSISVNFDSVPDYYWVVSPADRFLDVNLSVVIVDDDRRRRRALDDAEFVGNVRYENNVVINNVIDITYVEERTRKNVRQVDVRRTKDLRESNTDDNEVRVFDGTVETDRNAKPKDVADVEDVKKNRRNRGGDVQRSEQVEQPSDDVKKSDQAAEPKAGGDDQQAVEGDALTYNELRKAGRTQPPPPPPDRERMRPPSLERKDPGLPWRDLKT